MLFTETHQHICRDFAVYYTNDCSILELNERSLFYMFLAETINEGSLHLYLTSLKNIGSL